MRLAVLALLAGLEAVPVHAAGAAPSVRAGGPGPMPLSTATVQNPHDLIRGEIPPPPSLSSAPWLNEFLEYQVKWGMFFVGWSNLQARRYENFNGRPAVHIVSEAKSNGFCDAFYPVHDLNESWMDAEHPEASFGYAKQLREGKFFRDEWVLYDYAQRTFLAKTVNRDQTFSIHAGTIPIPVQDILSSLYYLRTQPLKVGDEITLDVNTKDNWPLVVRVLRKSHIEVPAGEFDAVVVEPFMRQEGIFVQKGKRLQIWLTNDARHIPVFMSVDVFFGSVTAALMQLPTPHSTPPPAPR